MNSFYTLLCLGIIPLFTIAQNMGPEISVADDNIYGKTRARIVMAANNIPVVMWGRKTSDKVYVSQFSGNTFSTPSLITPGTVEAFVTDWAGPDIASNGDDIFVTFHSQPEADGFVYIVKSTDGGLTFGDTVRVDDIGADQSRFPVLAVDDNSNPAVMFMRFSGNWIDPQYVVANSTNGGISFNVDVSASEIAPGEVCDCCPAALLNQGQRQVAMFRNNDNNLRDLWVTVSGDNGADFDTGGDMDPNNWMINSCPSSGPDGFIDGDSLYTVWMSAGQGSSRVYMSSVHLPTATRGTTWEIAPNQNSSANQNYPRIAGEGDIMGIVYQESASGNIDCYITISTDGGSSFSTPTLLHEDASGTQRNPDISYADGQFHVVFEDIGAGSLIYRTVSLPGVGIEEIDIEANVWATDGHVRIELQQETTCHIEITNALGQIVYSHSLKQDRAEIPITSSGLAIVRISTETGQTVKRLMLN